VVYAHPITDGDVTVCKMASGQAEPGLVESAEEYAMQPGHENTFYWLVEGVVNSNALATFCSVNGIRTHMQNTVMWLREGNTF
jgi:hypothetical protein